MGNICENTKQPRQDIIYGNKINNPYIVENQTNYIVDTTAINQNGPFVCMDSQKVELFFSCRNLLDLDTFSKSDPRLTLYQQVQGGAWSIIGNTEIIQDNLNPDFSKSFIIDYIFECTQILKVEVVDVDSETDFDFIGSTTFELGELMGSKNNMLIVNLIHKKDSSNNLKMGGKLIVRSEAISENNDYIILDFSGKNFDCDGYFGKAGSPF